MSVQRYDHYTEQEYPWHSDIEERDDGEFVLFKDYAALEARCDGMERERDDVAGKAVEMIRAGVAERDALQAKLAAAVKALRQCHIAFDLLYKAKDEDRDSFGWAWDEAWEKIEEAQSIAAALADTTTGEVQP